LPRNSQNHRRVIITTAVLAALLLVGVIMMRTDLAEAQRGLPPDNAATVASEDAAATNTQTELPPTGAEPPSLFSAVIKMISALALVIALVYGALYLLRRLMGRRLRGSGGKGSLEVLETTYVGQHKAISLVRVGQRSVLVGVTDNQITTLTELDNEETEEILGTSPQAARTESFPGVLSGAVDKLKNIGLRKKQTALET
jgi:flagellar protein FliO/FliZ